MNISNITNEERKKFRLDDFPQTNDELSKFIFDLIGFNAENERLSEREWQLFNTSLNNGLELELTNRQIDVLSMLDYELSAVKRFAGMPNMHSERADTTVAHSKQVMRLLDRVFKNAFGDELSPKMKGLRRQAMLGAGLHDMGELVTELTTADDVFHMSSEERDVVSEAKDKFERGLFIISCEISAYEIDHPEKKGIFSETIEDMREASSKIKAISKASGENKSTTILNMIEAMEDIMDEARAYCKLSKETGEDTKQFLQFYDAVEIKGSADNFLHPFVKTVECAEGQRYLQRNAERSGEHMKLCYSTSHQVMESIRRMERRLPLLFERASDEEKRQLAVATADMVYETVINPCSEAPNRRYGQYPAFINRNPDARDEVNGMDLKETSIPHVRANTHSLLADKKAQNNKGMESEIYTRAEIAKLYNAARVALQKNPEYAFIPQGKCLLDVGAIPRSLGSIMDRQEAASGVDIPHK